MAMLSPEVGLRAWTPDDLDVLVGLNAPEATAHLGGPETDEKVRARLARYVSPSPGGGKMFVIVVGGSAVGSVGYWPREWHGEDVYEMGWGVLPEHRGHGVARKAAAMVIDIARQDGSCMAIHAFPSPNNLSSNAICRANGFILLGEATVEYPPGHWMRVNDWRLRLAECPCSDDDSATG